jgi:type I restriction enzyme M protein
VTARDAASSLVRRLWHYCNVLRDDGLSYPDYVEQLTYLLFLKMADEQEAGPVPAEFGWQSFAELDAGAMHRQYGRVLGALGDRGGTLGLIFGNAKNKIRDPAKLRLLVVDLIGQTHWSGVSADVKGDAYEGLLEKNARDTKSGAGQYFTPRPLIEAIVKCVAPMPGEVICDPACGTAGFLLATFDYIQSQHTDMDATDREHLRKRALRGVELVPEVARLATMNLLLHGVSGETDDELPILVADSLMAPPGEQIDVVLTNPPFGVKSSITYSGNEKRSSGTADDLTITRPDFWVETNNKQLNFLQHIVTLLKRGGRAAVVVPDNVLFEAGAAATIRRRMMEMCDIHTVLRLPAGLFYAQGVKSNVLFFDKLRPDAVPEGMCWIYDLRLDNRFTLKSRPIQAADIEEFVELYKPERRAQRGEDKTSPRWRGFTHEEILDTATCRLDLQWSDDTTSPAVASVSNLDDIAQQIVADLERALAHISRVTTPK